MEYGIKELKENYEKLAKKHKLPGFDELNQNFDIEKIDRESRVLLKHVRKVVMEKIVNSLSFLEMLLNPMNVPRMYMVYVNSMRESDRKLVSEIYSQFSDLIVLSLDREVEYDEKKEAELIVKITSVWNKNKEEIKKILEGVKKPVSNEKVEKNYFG